MRVTFHHQRLRQKRKEKHMSQEMLAERCNCSVRYLRDLERGVKCNLSASLLFQIVIELDVSAEELMCIETEEYCEY